MSSRRFSGRLAFVATAVLVIAALAASSAVLVSSPPARAASVSITLYGTMMDGWSLTPGGEANPGPTLSFNAGDSVTVRVVSEDTLTHGFFVDLDDDSAISTGDINSPQGTDVTFTVTVPNAPGSHYYYCSLHSGDDVYGGAYLPGALMSGVFNVNGGPIAAFAEPVAASSWTGGSTHDIRFNLADEDPPTSLTAWVNYSYNGGAQGGTIAGPIAGTANPNVVSWTVPTINAADVVVSVTGKDPAGAVGETKSSSFEIDSTAPTIVDRVPAPMASDVLRSTTVRVTWSEGMDIAASGAPTTFAVSRVQDGAWIPGNVSWSPDGRLATFRPATALDASTSFEVHVNASAKDDSDPGRSVAAPDAWNFTTGTTLDAMPPTVANAAATPASQVGGGLVTITADVTDDLSVASVSAQVLGPSTDLNLTMSPAGGSTWTVTHTFSAPGSYTFAVWAIDGSGNTASTGGGFTISPSPLPAPSSVATAVDPSGTAVVITWSAGTNPNVTGYHVYRSASSGAAYTRLTTSPVPASGALRYTDTTVQAGGTYYYVVTAVDAGGGESPFSPESSIVVPSAAPPPSSDATLWIIGAVVGIGIVLALAMVLLRRRRPGKPAK